MNDAIDYANLKKQEITDELQGLLTNNDTVYNNQATQAGINQQSLLDTLSSNRQAAKSGFEADARSAYITKQLSKKDVNNELIRMNLGDSGFGLTQKGQVNTNYGNTIGDLQTTRDSSLSAIGSQEATAQTNYADTLLGIRAEQANKNTELSKYISKRGEDTYNTEYGNYIDEQKRLQDLQDTLFDKIIKERQMQVSEYNATKSTSSSYGSYTPNFGSTGTESTESTEQIPTESTEQVPAGTTKTENATITTTYDRPTQINNNNVSDTKYEVRDVMDKSITNSLGKSIKNEPIYQSGGRYYFYDEGFGGYVDITDKYNAKYSNRNILQKTGDWFDRWR